MRTRTKLRSGVAGYNRARDCANHLRRGTQRLDRGRAGVDEGGDDLGGFGQVNTCGVDHQIVGGGVLDVGVEMGAHVALPRKVASGVVGEGVGYIQLEQLRYVPGAMIGRSDEAEV